MRQRRKEPASSKIRKEKLPPFSHCGHGLAALCGLSSPRTNKGEKEFRAHQKKGEYPGGEGLEREIEGVERCENTRPSPRALQNDQGPKGVVGCWDGMVVRWLVGGFVGPPRVCIIHFVH